MPHHRLLEDVASTKTWLTIGSFDGVHLGHQQLIKELVASAHNVGEKASVLTFYPHPLVVLRGIKSAYYLTSPDEKAELLLSLGVDDVITIPFSHELAEMTALQFMQLLKTHIGITNLWVGYDFALGHNRQGDIPNLTHIGRDLGYQVHVFQPVLEHPSDAGNEGAETHEPISSRLIRRLLSGGEVGRAAALLGRYYDIKGKIVHGDGRGRLLGIPTTNLEYDPERLLPRPGIYVTLAHHGSQVIPAVTNIGTNPTFISDAMAILRVETHLLDFSGDLYGADQHLDFIEFVRSEAKFDSVEALKDRIHEDIRIARHTLASLK